MHFRDIIYKHTCPNCGSKNTERIDGIVGTIISKAIDGSRSRIKCNNCGYTEKLKLNDIFEDPAIH